MNYTTLSLTEVGSALEDIARDAQATFGKIDAAQLNWRPDAASWSVAQCFAHLVTANRLMLAAMEDALNGVQPRTIWQRLPFWPGLLGRLLIQSQAPTTTRKFTAPSQAQPALSDIPADVIAHFVEQQRDAAARVRALDTARAAGTIMTSPFVRVVTYSVTDGCRLLVAHDHRHVEQARRVTQQPSFPRA